MEMEKLQKKLKKYRGLRKNFIDLIEGFSSSSDSSDTDSSSEAEMEAAPKEWEDDLSDLETDDEECRDLYENRQSRMAHNPFGAPPPNFLGGGQQQVTQQCPL